MAKNKLLEGREAQPEEEGDKVREFFTPYMKRSSLNDP